MNNIILHNTWHVNFQKASRYTLMLFFMVATSLLTLNAQTVYTVNTAMDAHVMTAGAGTGISTNGGISLRSAIEDATAQVVLSAGDYIINVPTFAGGIMNLTLGQINVDPGPRRISIQIIGPGKDLLTINQTTPDRIFSAGFAGGNDFYFKISDLSLKYMNATPFASSGGAFNTIGNLGIYRMNNIAFLDFNVTGNGAAVSIGSGGYLTSAEVNNCVFTNNTAGGAGGALQYAGLGNHSVTINNCVFTGNTAGTQGGAINITGDGTGVVTVNIKENSFINNAANGDPFGGGAISIFNAANNNINYNRFVGNTATNASNGKQVTTTNGNVSSFNVDNNWWGNNSGPSSTDVGDGFPVVQKAVGKWLQLKNTASTSPICVGATSTITASFLSNNLNEVIATSGLDGLIGLPITFGSAVNGNLSTPQTTIQPAGTATVTFTATAVGNGTAIATLAPLVENAMVTTNPAINISNAGCVSNNANLSNLVVLNGVTAVPLSPVFSAGQITYSASVANSVTSVTVTPTVADATATVKVNGTTVSSGNPSGSITLVVGNNPITVVVTAQDGTTIKTYTVNVNRAAPAGCSPDVTPPVITPKVNVTVNLDNAGNATITKTDVTTSITDLCDPNPAVVLNRTTFSCADIVRTPIYGGGYQSYNVGTPTGNQAWQGELGLVFRVENPLGIMVKQLGVFDHEGNGIMGNQGDGNNSIHVAIYKRSTQTIVPGLDAFITGNADTYNNNHRLKNVTPVNLGPGEYVLVAKGYNALELNGNRNIPGIPINVSDLNTGNSSISFIGSSYGDDNPAGFSFPVNSFAGNNPWLAGTFTFDAPTGAINTTNTVPVTVTATDASTNSSQVIVTVTVADPFNVCTVISPCLTDVTPPALVPKNVSVNLNASGNATIVKADVVQSLVDNCDANPVVTFSRSTFSCADIITVPSSAGNFLAYQVGTATGNQAWLGELGLEFRVNNPQGIVVKQLGAFDHQGNGITGTQGPGNNSIRVAIFNKTTQLIVSGLDVMINGIADEYAGNHRMKNVTPVTLLPGNYVVVTKGYNAAELNGNRNLPSIPSSSTDLMNGSGAISFIASSYGNDIGGAGFAFPANTFAQVNPWLAGTLKYDVPTGGNTVYNTVPIIVTATDASGNSNQVNAIVTILDPGGVCSGITPCTNDLSAPVLITKNKTVQLNAAGSATITTADVVQSLSDNCDPNPTVTLSKNTFTCADRVTVPASAGTFQAFNVSTTLGNQAWEGELGMEFHVNNPLGILVKQLGAFDHLGNGIFGTQGAGSNSVRVAIFNKTTQTIVPGLDVLITGNADAYTGNHRMKNITPVNLPVGDYVVVTKGYGPSELNGNRNIAGIPIVATDLNNGGGAITFIGSSYGSNPSVGFNYPANAYAPVNPWLAGTLQFDVPTGGTTINNVVPIVVTATDASLNARQVTAWITVEDPTNGCIPVPKAIEIPITRISEITTDKVGIRSYPNPAIGGLFTVQLRNLSVPSVTLQVINQNGKMIEQKTINLTGKTESLLVPFDLKKQARGMYFVKVMSRDGVETSKIVVQ